MKKKIMTLLCDILCIIMISSCTSIYVDVAPPETTALVEVNVEQEYFTTGHLRKDPNAYDGFLYNGVWIYLEYNEYDKYMATLADGSDVYQQVQVCRIVKANPSTGEVNSICLDPVCNHSPGSGCIAMLPSGYNYGVIQGLAGDWLLYQFNRRDSELGLIHDGYMYNLKTGELFNIMNEGLAETVLTKWTSRTILEDKIYGVKNVLDYSNSGYDPKGKKPLSDYRPESKSILCELDLNTRETKELFEIPYGYYLIDVSNKRFFFCDNNRVQIFTCDLNGENMKKEEVLDFTIEASCGKLAYGLDTLKKNEFYVYDVTTDTKKTFPLSDPYGYIWLYHAGIIERKMENTERYYSITKDEELRKYIAEQKSLGLTEKEVMIKLGEEMDKINYTMDSTLYLCRDFDGEGEFEKIFTLKNGVLSPFHATDKYIFCGIDIGDPENDYKKIEHSASGRFYIDITTGEITEFSFLELVVPPEDRKPEQ